MAHGSWNDHVAQVQLVFGAFGEQSTHAGVAVVQGAVTVLQNGLDAVDPLRLKVFAQENALQWNRMGGVEVLVFMAPRPYMVVCTPLTVSPANRMPILAPAKTSHQ